MLRRSKGIGPGDHRLSYADLELDEETRDVWRSGKLIELTVTEYKLLHYLLSNARRVLTNLRHKVDAVDPPLIHTVRGVGYTLRLPPDRG